MPDGDRRPWAWRSLLAIVAMGLAALLFASATPETAEPKIDIEYEGFTVAGARATVETVRQRIAGLTLDEALELEDALVAEFPLLEGLVAPDMPKGLGLVIFAVFAPLLAGLFGAFIRRRFGSSLGPWILAGAVLAAAQGLGVGATEYLTRQDADAVLLVLFGVLGGTGWVALGVVYFPNLVATFPTGALPSRRWRWLWWVSGGAAAVFVALTTLGPLFAFDTRVNPIGLLSPGVFLASFNVGLALWAVSVLGAGVALVVRFVRSRGDERQQLKWAVVGVVFAAAANLVGNLLDQGEFPAELTGVIKVVPVFVLLPIILIITVFRHRLYDVDLVINRAVMVAILASVITAIYLGVTLGAGVILGTEQIGFDIQVGAAVAVAVAFNPVYRRARRLANRMVFGLRATPYDVLARFSHRAAEVSDGQVLERIPRLVVDGTGAVAATLWVRSGDRLQPAAAWPDDTVRDPIDLSGGFVDPEADYSLPIRNAGELLGGLSLSKQRGEAMPPSEERLLEGLATGLGVVLRNTALRSELREQVEALSASRDRVVAAADEARRALERDLDSGPQQRLVAIKVMLGPIRKQAERAGAEKTAQILAQLEDDAGAAIQAVREFAGGIYPPLLEAEGLATAVAHQARRSPVPVGVEARDLGRHPREVEAAAYFTILEALQNAVKHAGASALEVTIEDGDEALVFSVRDDGRGFDPASVRRGSGVSNMSDRLDAVGGTFQIDSQPGMGTMVQGVIPLGEA